MCEQDLRLGSEQQSAIEHAPIERFFTKAIAGDKQTPELFVPQRECKHPVEVLDHVAAVLLIKMRQDFSVRFTAEPMAASFEVVAQFAIVINLAVENYRDAVIFIESWLLATEQ